MTRFLRVGGIAAFLILLAFFLHWQRDYVMTSPIEFYRRAQAALKRGDEHGAALALAQWCESDKAAPECRYYSAVLTEIAERKGKSKAAALGYRLTHNNVLAGR